MHQCQGRGVEELGAEGSLSKGAMVVEGLEIGRHASPGTASARSSRRWARGRVKEGRRRLGMETRRRVEGGWIRSKNSCATSISPR
jgi:hypothetical protein